MDNKQILGIIQKAHWVKRWAGSYTFISCSYWAKQYDEILNNILGVGLKTSLFIHRKGTVTFLLKKEDLDHFGEYVAKKAEQDNKYAIDLLEELKDNTDKIMKLMDELEGTIPIFEDYERFLLVFERHLAFHNFMKKSVDYMPKELLDKLLPYFKDARIYSESVYSRTEKFFRAIAKSIGEKENYNKDILTCLTQEDLEDYIKNKRLPDKDILEDRYDASVLLFDKGKLHILTGDDVAEIEKATSKEDAGVIKGVSAFPGKVSGVCRIVPDPFNVGEFNEGDILVTGMTRPEFMPLVQKAAAIITDIGGTLCHAAIVSREMKKPCIIGTENSTQILKDGDEVEVDADNGMVRILNK